MSIESDLRRDGIIVTSILNSSKVNSIAKKVAKILVASFPEQDFNTEELYITLSQIPMYRASVPKGYSEANYLYKNTSIYFNENIPTKDLTNYAIHECIHYLQTRKDMWGNLLKLGLCDLTRFNVHGLGINEAAVQYATSIALNTPLDTVKYYGISFDTISPNCYPLVCNLIAQMAFVTGEDVLLDSTFNSKNDFKNLFVKCTSQEAYTTIEKNFDRILSAEESLVKYSNKLENSEHDNPNLSRHISTLKNTIVTLFLETQNLIISSYFENAYTKIHSIADLEDFRTSLYNYSHLIGVIDGDNFYNKFYINMMAKLENRYTEIENGYYDSPTANLVPTNTSFVSTFVRKVKSIVFKPVLDYFSNFNR